MLLDDAKRLFGTEDAIGREVDITVSGKTSTYTIVGLRDHMNEMYEFIMEGQDYFCQIEAPYTAIGTDFDMRTDEFTQLILFDEQSTLNESVNRAKEILINRHGLRGTTAISG